MTTGHPNPGLPGGPPIGSHDNGTGGQPVVPMLSIPQAMPNDPRTLKAAIFSAANKRLKSEIIEFFGQKIEIRQGKLSQIFKQMEDDEEDPMKRGLYVLLNFTFVPGTDLPVFDDADVEQLSDLPFGEDFNKVLEAYGRVTGIDLKATRKNSKPDSSASKS